ncbi:MAG: low molecular weight phosphatase family protein [Bacteroidota bacterium]
MKNALFLCTGNYYRSRTAEELFNHYSMQSGLGWKAFSRGLRQNMAESPNVGPISPHAVKFLDRLGIPAVGRDRMPIAFTIEDATHSDLIVAVSLAEHKPVIHERFPALTDVIRFWDIEDTHIATPDEVLPILHHYVKSLIEELQGFSGA